MKDKTLKQLVESIKASGQPKTSAYDTSATVTRVENGVAWVHIPGGVRETPVKLTINAKAGDNVQVRVSGGRAFMVGNATAPPTDDHTARQALAETRTVSKVVKAVQTVAEKAAKIAGNTNQYFWHTQEGTDTGAHITEIPQEDFLADPENGGGNLLARSNGVAIRDGLTELAGFLSNAFFVGIDPNAKISYDTSNGLRLGSNVSILPSGVFRVDYYDYEFAVNPINQYVFMRAYDNRMQVSQGGVDILTDGNGINIEATDGGVDLSSISSTAIDSSLSAHVGVDQSSTGSMASMTAHTVAINAENGTAHPTGAIILMTGNVRIGNSNRADNLDVYGNITAHSVQSYTPTWETGQEAVNYHCVVSAGICHLFYQGQITQHATGTLLGTLPVGARPKGQTFCPFVKAGLAYGTIRIETTGEIYVGFISSTTASNRVYFNCSYPVV